MTAEAKDLVPDFLVSASSFCGFRFEMVPAACLLVFFYLSDVFLWFVRNISFDLWVPGLSTVFTSEVRSWLWPFLAGRAGWKRSWALVTPNFLICSISGFYTGESSSSHIRITWVGGGRVLNLPVLRPHPATMTSALFKSLLVHLPSPRSQCTDNSENQWLNDFKGPVRFCHFISSLCPSLKLRFLFF